MVIMDSGSAVSVVSCQLLTKEQKKEIKRNKNKETFTVANGKEMVTLGHFRIRLGFEAYIFDTTFRVSKQCAVPCIIGFDIITKLEQRKLQWTGIEPLSADILKMERESSRRFKQDLIEGKFTEEEATGSNDEVALLTQPVRKRGEILTDPISTGCAIMSCLPKERTSTNIPWKMVILVIIVCFLQVRAKTTPLFEVLYFVPGIITPIGIIDFNRDPLPTDHYRLYVQEMNADVGKLPLRKNIVCQINEEAQIIANAWYTCDVIAKRCECHFAPLMTRYHQRIERRYEEMVVAVYPPEDREMETPLRTIENDETPTVTLIKPRRKLRPTPPTQGTKNSKSTKVTSIRTTTGTTMTSTIGSRQLTKRLKMRFAPLVQNSTMVINDTTKTTISEMKNRTTVTENITIVMYQIGNIPLSMWIPIAIIGNVTMILISCALCQSIARCKHKTGRERLFKKIKDKYGPPVSFKEPPHVCSSGTDTPSVEDGLDWLQLKQIVDIDSLEDSFSEKTTILRSNSEYGCHAPNEDGYSEEYV